MDKANKDIRNAVKAAGVCMWQVADAFGMSESGFCKRMRFEFAPEERQRVLAIIEELKVKNGKEE